MKYVSPQTEKRKQQQKKRKKQLLIIALFAVLVVAAFALFSLLGNRDKTDKVQDSQQIQDVQTDEQQTPQPTETPQADEEDVKSDKTEKPAKKQKKNKTSVFAGIKAIFSKIEPMEKTFPVMAFGKSIEEEAGTIVSLSPMATEFILSSPSQNALVGVSNYCNSYSFNKLETVGTPLLPNISKIILLEPDYVIVQTPLSETDRIKLEQSGIIILQLNAPQSLDDLKEIYRSVTALTQGGEIATFDAQRFADSLGQKLDLYAKALESVDKKDVVMLFNSYGMVATKDTLEGKILSGFFDVAIEGKNYTNEDFAAISASNPQVIIASSYMTEADLINMGFGESIAFAEGNVFYVDIQQFENCSAKIIDVLAGIANSVYGNAITVQIMQETLQ